MLLDKITFKYCLHKNYIWRECNIFNQVLQNFKYLNIFKTPKNLEMRQEVNINHQGHSETEKVTLCDTKMYPDTKKLTGKIIITILRSKNVLNHTYKSYRISFKNKNWKKLWLSNI